MKLTVRVQPNAKTSEIVGCADGVWKIKLKAPAMEGKANEELIRVLSEEYNVPKSRISIVKGLMSKTKVVEVG
jgi:uncharacterized protein (TIGR00251 family)